jgi:prepilin-type N-terminal cleavage/methylation domain-containing protein
MMMYRNRKMRAVRMLNLAYPQARLDCSYIKSNDGYNFRGRITGFTLVELLIVVAIISIAALTAIPMMSSAASMQIRSAANMLTADLEYAKSMAISRGQNYSMVFDQNADSYWIEDLGGNVIPHPVKKGFDYIVDFRGDSRLNRVDITDADFSGNPVVIFNSMGSPDSGGTVSLEAGGTTVTIEVVPITGYISIN